MVVADRAYLGLQCKLDAERHACVCYNIQCTVIQPDTCLLLFVSGHYIIYVTQRSYPLHLPSFKPLHNGHSGDRENWILQRGGHLGVRGDTQFFRQVKHCIIIFFKNNAYFMQVTQSIIQNLTETEISDVQCRSSFMTFYNTKGGFASTICHSLNNWPLSRGQGGIWDLLQWLLLLSRGGQCREVTISQSECLYWPPTGTK